MSSKQISKYFAEPHTIDYVISILHLPPTLCTACPRALHAVDKRNNMRATSLFFALTFVLLGASAYANNSDENKYICFDPTKFQASSSFRSGR